jgi:hypothetical protein
MGIPGYPEFLTHRTPEEIPASEVAAATLPAGASTLAGSA